MLLLASCGQQHHAKKTVKQFIERYAVSPDKIARRDFVKFDSTRVVADSIIRRLQSNHDPHFKEGIPFASYNYGNKLFTLRMSTVVDSDSLQYTFYLNEKLDSVVAFK